MTRVLIPLACLILAAVLIGCSASSAPSGVSGPAPSATEGAASNNVTESPTAAPALSKSAAPAPAPESRGVVPGIAALVEEQRQLVEGKRIGLITNSTGVDADLRSDVELLQSVPGATLVALFAGEHGLRGAEEAGKKLEGSIDPYTGAPVYSLYGETLRPKAQWLQGIDVLLFDIQNVGASIYTYKFTMSFAMEAAARAGIPFVVLDRPNPAGGAIVEGPMLPARDIWRHPLPVRHGMTNGELATMWNEEYRMGSKLTVVKVKGWKRDMTWDETGLPWVIPSPNIPTADTALAYTGQGLIESVSDVSEGRGTTKPFLITGAPWVDAVKAAADLNARNLPGVSFRPVYFMPAKPGEKFNGKMSGGVELYFTDRKAYQAVRTTLSILDAYRRSASHDLSPVRGAPIPGLTSGESVEQRVASYQEGIQDFLKVRQKYLLYE